MSFSNIHFLSRSIVFMRRKSILKSEYSAPSTTEARKGELISEMRQNLLERNDGEDDITSYPFHELIHISKADTDGLYKADATLHHLKK